jgi:5-methylcytosine-specific restriction endonuclease McrA
MGEVRTFSKHIRWEADEVAFLMAHYAAAPLDELELGLPGRHRRMIQCKANGLGLVRYRAPPRTPDEVRQAKREHMARRRVADPEAVRAYQRQRHALHRNEHNNWHRERRHRRLFWSRATRLKGVSASDLARLWHAQRGLCALTGRKLDRTAQVDHKLPRARGGGDEITNLRWVCRVANEAKRHMTDAELFALCTDIILAQRLPVVRWIGERIAAVTMRQ